MGMPDSSDKENIPNFPQGSDNNRNAAQPLNGSLRNQLQIKSEIMNSLHMDEKQRLAQLLEFRTSSHLRSTLGEYVRRMVAGQTDIYFMIGRNVNYLIHSPFVRRIVNAGLEVVYMIDPIVDGQVVRKLGKCYNHHRLVSVHTENLELPRLAGNVQQRKKRQREALDEFLPLCKRLKSVYPQQIKKIVISNTLVQSSCAIVLNDEDPVDDDVPCYDVNPTSGRVRLEINPDSDSLKLLCLQAKVLEKKQEEFDDLVKFLFGPPTSEDSIVVGQPRCSSPSSDSSF